MLSNSNENEGTADTAVGAIEGVATGALQHRKALRGVGLARFLQLRGHRIIEALGVLWYNVKHRLYMSLPYEVNLDLDRAQVNEMLRSMGALGVRFPSGSRPGLVSGLYVYQKRPYDLHALHRNFRAKVRQGLDSCHVHRIEESDLLNQGLQLNLETMKRQGRFDPEFGDPKQWKRFVDAVYQCPEIAPIGAFLDNRLLAYAITCQEDGWLHVLHMMSRTDERAHCPNHALTFVIAQEINTNRAIEAVCLGFKSLLDNEGLHEYKRRLGFEMRPQN